MTSRIHTRQGSHHYFMGEGVQNTIRLDRGGMLSRRLFLGGPIQDSEIGGIPTFGSLETA